MRIKVFDWPWNFGMIALIICVGTAPIFAQEEPPKRLKADQSKVVDEDDVSDFEEEGGIVITVKVPKPEVLLFSKPMETKYEEIGYEKSFLSKIQDAAKHSPF